MKTFRVLGIMSGTSLDGVDLALCTFKKTGTQWNFTVEAAATIAYDEQWKMYLTNLHTRRAEEFAFMHSRYGHYLGKLAADFLKKNKKKADFIASHGHTVFHQPSRGFTFQIGDGASISAVSGLPVVCDFRTMDVALNGQGAPLVPIGDALLFKEYKACLNLGGIANISSHGGSSSSKQRTATATATAFDVCPCNMVLNNLAAELGKVYDDKGKLAQSGTINKELLSQLNDLPYYKTKGKAKSLGREDVEKDFSSIVQTAPCSVQDKLATFCEHIAKQVSLAVKNEKPKKILVTGGGAYNDFLIERLRFHTKSTIVLPEKEIIEFKEAIIFAFLGLLRWTGEVNCLKSVTGADRDSIGGAVYLSS